MQLEGSPEFSPIGAWRSLGLAWLAAVGAGEGISRGRQQHCQAREIPEGFAGFPWICNIYPLKQEVSSSLGLKAHKLSTRMHVLMPCGTMRWHKGLSVLAGSGLWEVT